MSDPDQGTKAAANGNERTTPDAAAMVRRLEAAIRTVAYVMDKHNEPGHAPLLDRLEKELAYYREGRDPLSRARAILKKG
jgi:glycosyltransferase A (GT-A) superfamily protein (DUF2064 family)